ncbi:hypothetical protein [Corynebacterium liangguodongii]|uniref:hypothetical protein n=1 Tax=Corynebacterium liangguodongii TaxID=2079535 RepID=UPI0015D0A46F|nr:hypothetical protein [Corynebacterium liangguodongii]
MVLGSLGRPALVAALIAVVCTPLIAVLTKGRYYRRRSHGGIEAPLFDAHRNPSDETFTCCVTGEEVLPQDLAPRG